MWHSLRRFPTPKFQAEFKKTEMAFSYLWHGRNNSEKHEWRAGPAGARATPRPQDTAPVHPLRLPSWARHSAIPSSAGILKSSYVYSWHRELAKAGPIAINLLFL